MKIITFLITSVIFLSSCYSTKPVYTGNIHSRALGKTKNQILRSYGLPQRTESDGANGSILVYENSVETTVTNVGSFSSLNGGTNTGAIYGRNGIAAASRTQANVIGNTNAVTRRSLDVQYCYLFLDSVSKVYDFKSNYGAEFNDYERCFDNVATTNLCVYSVATLVLWPVVIPWAIIEKKKAKRNGIPMCY
jgi:hypothetical protein